MFIFTVFRQLFVTLFAFFYLQIGYAEEKSFTLELQHAPLSQTIHLLANFLHMNVMISTAVKGEVNLYFDHANPWDAFSMLLTSQGLIKWQHGNIWYVAPRNEFIRERQEELKWQELEEATAQVVARLWRIKYAKVEDIARIIQTEKGSLLSKVGYLHTDTRTNSLYVRDILKHIKQVDQLIKCLDVPIQQIAIYVRLASVDYDTERELGIHFEVKSISKEKAGVGAPVTQEAGHYNLAFVKLADSSLIDVKLSALENTGHAELISSPRLFTANQQPASIEAGEELPYQEVSESGGTAVVFKKAVLGMQVTPQVLPGKRVILQLQINQDRPGNKMVLGMPTISTRQIKTSVVVKDGETLVLGGIYEMNKENAEMHTPFISQIPVIGMLFKQHSKRENKRELLIFVTPKIMS